LPGFRPLNDSDRDTALELLSRDIEHNMLVVHNIHYVGMDPGSGGTHGDYFGREGVEGLTALGVLYGLGSLFVYAVSDDALDGAGEYLLGLGRAPRFAAGKPSHLLPVLEHVDGHLCRVASLVPSDLLVLTGSVPDDAGAGSRPAAAAELEELVEMQVSMEEELFDGIATARAATREIFETHLADRTCYVCEAEGRIVSKAEGAMAGRIGANTGGVYTLPAFRGHGYASACVGGLCARLLEDVPFISLNVAKSNKQAQALYRRIGFTKKDDRLIATMVPLS